MEDDSLGFELDPTLDDNGMLGLQPNSCEADREEAVFILEDFETEAESETTSLDQPMEIDAADDNLADTDLGEVPDPALLFRFAFIIGRTLVSKFGLSYLLQNTWTARSVAFSSYFSGIGGLEVALAYLNAAFKALASWICFLFILYSALASLSCLKFFPTIGKLYVLIKESLNNILYSPFLFVG